MENPVIKFVQEGGDLLSEAGSEVINNAERSEIKAAFEQDQQCLQSFKKIMASSGDPLRKRKVMLAITE